MSLSFDLLYSNSNPRSNILFLGYDRSETVIIDKLIEKKCSVWHTKEEFQKIKGNLDLIISFGYRHIIKKDILNENIPILNLHISYLPWNRGAHPNFWSFFDDTPKGVSIHLIDEGIDTGDILFQRNINFEKSEKTFSRTYKRLKKEIEKLFIDKIDNIIDKKFNPYSQNDIGTLHKVSDLPENFSGWNSNIHEEINRLKLIKNNYVK